MHSPAVALAWELWRRHRPRIIAVVGFFFGFALLYPILCASAGFNPANSDPLGEIAKMVPGLGDGAPTVSRFFQLLLFFFLICGPWLAMIVSLVCVMWMFTLIEMDPKTKALTFPGRLFTLPVSTPFLFRLLVLSGMACIVVLYGCWIHLVQLPHLEMFETYRSCLGWMTLLALMQGIVWALDGWPNIRMALLASVFLGFMFSPAQRHFFQSPCVLPPLLLLGVALARVGLQKMRLGHWQGWAAPMSLGTTRARVRKGSRRFASPAHAQLWFEWRRISRPICLYAAGVTFAPVAIFLGMRFVFGRPLQDHDLAVFACCLIGVPLFIHFIFAMTAPKTDLPFLMTRPLSNGEMLMPKLKAAAISTVVSWGFVLAALCAMPLLGDFSGVLRSTSVPWKGWVVIAIGLIFLTWRFIPVNLSFVLSGHRRLAELPSWMALVIPLVAGMILVTLAQDQALWNVFFRLLPFLLAGLVALKFLLAFVAFRRSLKRRLLSQSAMFGYLLVWCSLVAFFLGLLEAMIPAAPHDWAAVLPLVLGIILLVPLVRIGFCPIALSWNRHSGKPISS